MENKTKIPTALTPEQIEHLRRKSECKIKENKRWEQISLGVISCRRGLCGNVFLDKGPDLCPFCHQSTPVKLTCNEYHFLEKQSLFEGDLYVIFRCVNIKCNALILAKYKADKNNEVYVFERIFPAPYRPEEFSAEIEKISPRFIKIYNQALVSEKEGLDEINGMGYRKALEYLIKDYLISKDRKKKKDIIKSPLVLCIEKYINDPRIQNCAKRAAWLGNDETHYYREWKNKDVQDLKNLLHAALAWIELEISTNRYVKKMPEKKKKKSS